MAATTTAGAKRRAPESSVTEDGQARTSSEDDDNELLSADGCVPTDAEAAIMLLRGKLYPDPAAAAAAAAAAKQGRAARRSKGAPGPSKAAAAAITAAAAAAAAARRLPRIILKSQLYTVLSDRTAADRELEALRQTGRVRVFKLGTGADEYAVMLADDYQAVLTRLATQQQQPDHHQQQPQPQQQLQQQQQSQQQEAIRRFRDRVVPACFDSSIDRQHLLQLMRSALAGAAGRGSSSSSKPPSAGAAAAAADAALERQLLAAEVVTRDSRCLDRYALTVPGAAAFIKSLVAGRQELLQLLGRKKYKEALESELACVKLRGGCCLTPSFITRDLQGRGLVSVVPTTAGQLVRLVVR